MKFWIAFCKIFVITLFLSSCKMDEFTSYKVESIEQNTSLRLTGTVYNYFTMDPVMAAKVTIGHRLTITDGQGHFVLQYPLSESETRNKPTVVLISAPNYYDLQDSVLISPQNTNFTYYLRYAAPIVQEMALVSQQSFDFNYICQAVVIDYQGIATLQKVKAVFFNQYILDDSLIVELSLKRTVSMREGHFQARFAFSKWQPTWFYIEATDQEGFSDRQTGSVRYNNELIFEP